MNEHPQKLFERSNCTSKYQLDPVAGDTTPQLVEAGIGKSVRSIAPEHSALPSELWPLNMFTFRVFIAGPAGYHWLRGGVGIEAVAIFKEGKETPPVIDPGIMASEKDTTNIATSLTAEAVLDKFLTSFSQVLPKVSSQRTMGRTEFLLHFSSIPLEIFVSSRPYTLLS